MKDEKIKAMQGEIALAHGVFQQPANGNSIGTDSAKRS